MDGILGLITGNWAVISANPTPFIATAILFLSFGFLAGRFMFGERISNLKSSNDRKLEIIADLEKRLAAAPATSAHAPLAPSRHPDGIYQNGERVGAVRKADLKLANGMATFEAISADGAFNRDQAFEYREWLLIVVRAAIDGAATFGGTHVQTMQHVECKILGKR